MAGYKTWGSSDIPSSTDVNGYLMQQAIPRFATVSARNSAISSPVLGQMCATDDFDELYRYDTGVSAWVGVVPRTKYKPATTTRTTSTMTNDPDLQITLEASSRYIMDYHFQTQGDTASDFQFTWSYTGTMAEAKVGVFTKPVGATTNNNSLSTLDAFTTPLSQTVQCGVITGDVGGLWGCGYWKTTTGGTLALQWARVAGSASIDLSFGSYISLLKVA